MNTRNKYLQLAHEQQCYWALNCFNDHVLLVHDIPGDFVNHSLDFVCIEQIGINTDE